MAVSDVHRLCVARNRTFPLNGGNFGERGNPRDIGMEFRTCLECSPADPGSPAGAGSFPDIFLIRFFLFPLRLFLCFTDDLLFFLPLFLLLLPDCLFLLCRKTAVRGRG